MANSKVATAYVQILPTTSGITSKLTSAMNSGATTAGNSAADTLGSTITSGFSASAIGLAIGAALGVALIKGIKEAVSEGADLEQSIGGIETLFKENADTVIAYANEAYTTAGLSANEYMENVTSFSAALISSMSGDTAAAAEVANQAMIDMSDNANKMGTDIESIQNAYQGFAKQNYTMLDNLKLGYGGTKTEMERLLEDAEEISGVEYDISNLSDVYNAIHVIQEDLGITGTTALEASETVTGSFNSMAAAAKNVLGAMALGENVETTVQQLVSTTKTFLVDNLIPMIGTVLQSLPGALITLFDSVADMIEGQGAGYGATIANSVTSALITYFVPLLKSLVNLVLTAVSELIDYMGAALTTMLKSIGVSILNSIKSIFTSLGNAFTSLDSYLWSGMEKVEQIPAYLKKIALSAISKFKNASWAQAGISAVKAITKGVTSLVTYIPNKMKTIANKALSTFKSISWKSAGTNIVKGIIKGITGSAGTLYSKITSMGTTALEKLKDKLGISSPSKVAEKEIGQQIPAGAAIGIEDSAYLFTDALNSALSLDNANLSNTTPALADSIVSGLGTIASGLSGSNNQPITVQTYLYPNSSTYYTETVNAYDTGKRRLATT